MVFHSVGRRPDGIGNIFKVKETVQLANSWNGLLESIKEPKGRVVSGFDDPTLSLKVIGVVCTVAIGLIGMITMGFIFPDLPIASHNILLRIGIGCSMTRFFLQVACVPFDLLLQMQPTLSSGFGITILVIGIDVLKVYNELLR